MIRDHIVHSQEIPLKISNHGLRNENEARGVILYAVRLDGFGSPLILFFLLHKLL
jgi:hypothetical protein